eukprot:6215335-Prorocentrum_lima.AAC.1
MEYSMGGSSKPMGKERGGGVTTTSPQKWKAQCSDLTSNRRWPSVTRARAEGSVTTVTGRGE